jgi:hypothetical protein
MLSAEHFSSRLSEPKLTLLKRLLREALPRKGPVFYARSGKSLLGSLFNVG